MKNLLPLFVLLVSQAQAQPECDPNSPKFLAHVQDPKIMKLVANDKSKVKINRIDSAPTRVTPTTVEYTLSPHIKIKPGECAYFNIPAHLRDKPIMFVVLGHRQADEDNTGWDASREYDNNPGLISVQVNQANAKNESQWRYWGGQSSGEFGAKFAEPRYDLELEGLYEWYHSGHYDVKTKTVSHAPLMIDGSRLCSVGKDPVTVGKFELKMYPGKPDKVEEYNWGEGNQMGDTLTAAGRKYGELKGSVVLNGSSEAKLPAGWTVSGDQLTIPLPAGKTLKTFEAAVSDTTAATLAQHEEGSTRTSGAGRLTVRIQRKDGTIVPLMNNENVPPHGVLYATPEKEIKAEAGDKLLIDGGYERVYLMGMKLGYDN